MDPLTIGGIVAALAAILGSMILEGSSPMALILPAPMVLVFVGTFAVGAGRHDAAQLPHSVKSLQKALMGAIPKSDELVTTIVKCAETARREGLLALESQSASIEEPLLRRGLELAIDGTDPDDLDEILEAEVESARKTARSAKLFEAMGGYAPTIGIIGTVIGLVHVLENLSDPAKLGQLIAAAFIATLWGVLSANVIWLPIGNKLKLVAELERTRDGAHRRGRAGDPGRRQPARGRPASCVALLPARPRLRLAREGGMTCAARSAQEEGGPRGARQPRAVAGDLRRHDHAADGAVHRAVRDQPGRPEEVHGARAGDAVRLRTARLDHGRGDQRAAGGVRREAGRRHRPGRVGRRRPRCWPRSWRTAPVATPRSRRRTPPRPATTRRSTRRRSS